MKKIFLSILFLYVLQAQSQDTLKIKQIDSLVKVINNSGLKTQYDSILQNHPELGLKMKTYLTAVTNGEELKKYVNKVNSEIKENGKVKKMNSSSTFYFDQYKLIKVEEFANQDEKQKHFDWYFANDKPIYYTMQSDKAVERATLLLAIAEGFLKQFKK